MRQIIVQFGSRSWESSFATWAGLWRQQISFLFPFGHKSMFIFERQMAWGKGRDANYSYLHSVSNRSEGLDKEMGHPVFHPGGSLADKQWSVAVGTHLGLVQVSIDSWWVVQSSFSISSWIWWVGRKRWTVLSILPAACLWFLFFTAVRGCHMIWKKSTLFCSADQVGRRMILPDPQFCFFLWQERLVSIVNTRKLIRTQRVDPFSGYLRVQRKRLVFD